MYKRLGLLIAGAVYAINIILNVLSVIAGYTTLQSIVLNTIISAAVLYYVYKYLTSEPEKTFFT